MQNKESIIALLLRLSQADNTGSTSEEQYIRAVCHAIGFDAERIDEIRNNLDNYPLDPPESEQDRMEILYYLLFQMKIDKQVTQEESDLIQKFGFKLGFNELLTRDMIGIIQEHAKQKVPPQKLIEIIKKYHN